MNGCFMSQLSYCPLVWMNHNRTFNTRISGLHKKALSLVNNDFSSSFPELIEKDKSVTIHHHILQTLAYEIFKVQNKMAPETVHQKDRNYSLRNSTALQGGSIKTYCSETISGLGPKIRDILPTELKKIVSPALFKKRTLEWVPKNFPYRLCKTYVQNVGFV